MTNEEIEARIADMEKTYEQTEKKIFATTGREQDAAIRYLAGCGNAIEALRRQLK